MAATAAALDEWVLVDLPAGPLGEVLLRNQRRRRLDGIVLGGGTLIGHPRYRAQLAIALRARPDLRAFALGTGVEDPSFPGRHSSEPRRELEAWVPLLKQFSRVAVRGPRSQQALADVGVASDVVGDIALLLGAAARPASPGLVGVNLGRWWSGWADDVTTNTKIAACGASLVARGYRLRILPVWPPDLGVARRLATQLGPACEVIEDAWRVEAYVRAVGECQVMLGTKLHSLVLAAACGIPTVAVEYQPKCRDFHDSIGRGQYTFRADAVEPGELTAAVSQAIAHVDEESRAVIARVGELQKRQRQLLQETAHSFGAHRAPGR